MSNAQIKRYDKVGRKQYKDKDRTKEYRYIRWRKEIFERDSFTCQICRKVGVYLESHHIKSWKNYPELRYVLDNGITLCRECHSKTDNYKKKALTI